MEKATRQASSRRGGRADAVPNYLFMNQGDWRFTETALRAGVAVAIEGKARAGMGTETGDYDGDGLIDLVVTNHEYEMTSCSATWAPAVRLRHGRHRPRLADASRATRASTSGSIASAAVAPLRPEAFAQFVAVAETA